MMMATASMAEVAAATADVPVVWGVGKMVGLRAMMAVEKVVT